MKSIWRRPFTWLCYVLVVLITAFYAYKLVAGTGSAMDVVSLVVFAISTVVFIRHRVYRTRDEREDEYFFLGAQWSLVTATVAWPFLYWFYPDARQALEMLLLVMWIPLAASYMAMRDVDSAEPEG